MCDALYGCARVYLYVHIYSLQWRHSGHDSASNHQPPDCLLNCLFRRRSTKKSKLRITGLCAGNSPGTGEFPALMASYAENVSIWWRHHICEKISKSSYLQCFVTPIIAFVNWYCVFMLSVPTTTTTLIGGECYAFILVAFCLLSFCMIATPREQLWTYFHDIYRIDRIW